MVNLIFVVPSIMLYSSEISPTELLHLVGLISLLYSYGGHVYDPCKPPTAFHYEVYGMVGSVWRSIQNIACNNLSTAAVKCGILKYVNLVLLRA
jgi:hypothetical protein